MVLSTYKKISLATLSAETINLASATNKYKLTGNKSVTAVLTISPTGTPKEGMTVLFHYNPGTVTAVKANYLAGSVGIVVFGATIPYDYIAKDLLIWCEYTNSAWEVFMLPSFKTLPLIGASSIATATWDGTTIAYDSATDSVKVNDGGITAAKLSVDAVETAKIKAKAVTINKLEDITRGSVLIGGADDTPTILTAKTSGQILIGDGTDIKSVAVSGDVTISAAGAVAIGANKVLAAMINAGEIVNSHIGAAAGIVFTKMAALTASKIPVLNASGFIEAGTVDATKLSFIDVTAGTAAASKAVVLDGSKQINEMDIVALKLNGSSVTATAAEMNYLSGATSNIQAQINAAPTVMTATTISGNTTATAATLKDFYWVNTSGGAVELTLPKADTVAAGKTVRIMQVGVNAAKAKANVADGLFDVDDLSTDQSSVDCVGTGKSITMRCNGVDGWNCIQKDYVYTAP